MTNLSLSHSPRLRETRPGGRYAALFRRGAKTWPEASTRLARGQPEAHVLAASAGGAIHGCILDKGKDKVSVPSLPTRPSDLRCGWCRVRSRRLWPETSERLSEAERRCQSSSATPARERDGLRRTRHRQRGPCPLPLAAILRPGPADRTSRRSTTPPERRSPAEARLTSEVQGHPQGSNGERQRWLIACRWPSTSLCWARLA